MSKQSRASVTPRIGNQERWRGGWERKKSGKIVPKQGGRLSILAKIFANPHLPEIDDYYEPFTFDYEHLQNAPELISDGARSAG